MLLSFPSVSPKRKAARSNRAGRAKTKSKSFDLLFVAIIFRKRKKTSDWMSFSLCWRLPIFPGRRQPSIFGTSELNFCVRDGNRWTLTAINTNLFVPCGTNSILTQQYVFVNTFLKIILIFYINGFSPIIPCSYL